MPVETLAGSITGTDGTDGNALFTLPSGVTPVNELLIHDGLVRTAGVGYNLGPSVGQITFLSPYIPIAGSNAPVCYYGSSVSIVPVTPGAGIDYTSTGLLAAIRDITYTGTSIRDWPDDRLLRLINREIEEYLVPFILEARKNHFATFADKLLVANQSLYPLPTRATGLKVRAVQIVDVNGNPYSDVSERELEDGIRYDASTGLPSVYWFVGNQISLYPTPTGSPTLSVRIYYINRPSQVVAQSSCIKISAFPGGAAPGSFRVQFTGTTPSSGYAIGNPIDLVQNVPGFDILLSSTISASTSTTLDIVGTQPSALAVGDWVSVAGNAPVVTGGIPEMVLGCLIRVCQLEVLSGKADDAAFGRATKMLSLAEKRAHQFLNRRNSAERPKIGMGALYRFKRSSGYGL